MAKRLNRLCSQVLIEKPVRRSPPVISPGENSRIKMFAVSCTKSILISTLCVLTLPSLYAAQENHEEARVDPGRLTQDDGLSILSAALDLPVRRSARQDCSHLVHAIYENAGFSYPYTRSFDLYNGIQNFQRVTQPQPGDLVVWRGHVGIVVNPTQHAFFSSMRSGLGMDDYEAPYWKKRGRARFYRYIATNPAQEMTTTKPRFRPTRNEQ